jgi:exodeoxyribonuclease V alpha subunit
MNDQLTDIHKVFADFFPDERIRPFAYLLSKKLQEGHICIPEDAPLQLPADSDYLLKRIPDFSKMKRLVSFAGNDLDVPFVYSHHRLYFQRYFKYETAIVAKIQELIRRSQSMHGLRKQQIETIKEKLLALSPTYKLEGLQAAEKTDWQLVAVIRALLSDFSIITGGPGTGKTTTLANLLYMVLTIEPDAAITLAAPTGKASMRMRESLQEKSGKFPEAIQNKITALRASTIHSLLGYKRGSIYFKHDASNPLSYNWIIIDEASMIDVPLFAKLLSAIGDQTRIILLGDKDQLASVEAGSLLGDLCQSVSELNLFSSDQRNWFNQFFSDKERLINPDFIRDGKETLALLDDHIIELKLSHRFKERGGIGKLSKAIINSRKQEVEEMLHNDANGEVVFVKDSFAESLKDFTRGYLAYLQEENIAIALEKLNKIRVLVAVRQGEYGLNEINRKIENILSQEARKYINPDRPFYYNRPVMVTRNNPELGLFNGDVGIVRYDEQKRLRVWFQSDQTPEGVRSFLPSYLSDCETVFAMTIHKSQGSEFDQVMVVLPDQADNRLLTRELIYTGITRARRKVIIYGSDEVIYAGIARSVERSSGLQQRLNESLAEN